MSQSAGPRLPGDRPPRPTDGQAPRARDDRVVRRILVLAAAIVLLLVVAIWKPWESGSATVPSTIPPGASDSLLPAITGVPGSDRSPGAS